MLVWIDTIGQWAGLGISYIFIFAVIGVAQLLLKAGLLDASATRKVVHIGVAHWWILAMLFIDDVWIAFIGPVSFILINWVSYRKHVFAAMEHPEARKNLGTVYFPIALTILVSLTWNGLFPTWYGLAAILVLGWGDGLASIVGEHLGTRNEALRFAVPGGRKSVFGTVAMFCAAGAVSALVLIVFAGSGRGHAPTVAGFGLWRTVVEELQRVGSYTWIGRPTDSTVLFALSRLDGLVRTGIERAADVAGNAGVAATIVEGAVVSGSWGMQPSTIAAAALVIAAIATAVELMTPRGMDNITVPLAVFAVLTLLMPLPGEWIVRLAWAVALNVFVAVVAYLRRSVTATGAIAGAFVGLAIYLSGGAFYWSILMAFFASSSIIGRLTGRRGASRDRKRAAESIHVKGGRRDAVQVLANGGLAAIMAACHAITGRPIFMLGFAILLAASTADTWASEIGVLSRRDPVSILTLRSIPRGTSGGVSSLGLAASLAGALFIGLWFAAGYRIVHGWNPRELGALVAAVTAGGFLGSVIDSLLGATVQAQYWDEVRQRHTERRNGSGGAPNRLVRGFHFVTNDLVNSLSGAVATATLFAVVV
ncbi:MAG: DUF92 domain-containing protein [Spirochaetales bacterium]|nr:DUF92 domain-containing protein [Spirochaetales bacterium]